MLQDRFNESFNQVCGQILLMDLLPSINVGFSMVTQDEKQREVTATLNPTETLIPCIVQANNSKVFKKDRPTCAHCGVVGNLKKKCFKLHEYPPGYKKPHSFKASNQSNNVNDHGNAGTKSFFDMTSQSYQQLINFLQAQMSKVVAFEENSSINSIIGMSFSTIDSHKSLCAKTWIVDSGDTSHICCDISLFDSSKPLLNKFVTLPNGNHIPIESIVNIVLNDTLVIQDVLYIPTFHVNLISVGKLLFNPHLKLIFNSHHFSIQDTKQSKMIGKGDLNSGLYIFEVDDVRPISSFDNTYNSISSFS